MSRCICVFCGKCVKWNYKYTDELTFALFSLLVTFASDELLLLAGRKNEMAGKLLRNVCIFIFLCCKKFSLNVNVHLFLHTSMKNIFNAKSSFFFIFVCSLFCREKQIDQSYVITIRYNFVELFKFI